MSRAGLLAAKLFGAKLPAFRDLADAERALLRQRDEFLRTLSDLSRHSATFRPDASAESLKELEHWYFELLEGAGFRSINTDQETFERAIAMYMGEVLVRNAPPFEWFVTEFAFGPPGRYEIGVQRPRFAVMSNRTPPAPRERTKRGQSLWRMYQQYARERTAP
jgi:hypothetical protein